MPATTPFVPLESIDFNTTLYDLAAIREVLPHRYEFEMLTAIVSVDPNNHIVVGYKNTSEEEFWCRGHFPGNPIMPGVLMCEAAAQLVAFYSLSQKINENVLMGLGGIEECRFRRGVRPGERLILLGKGERLRPRLTQFRVQGFVNHEPTFEATIMGVILARTES